jgi:hypothetical protein
MRFNVGSWIYISKRQAVLQSLFKGAGVANCSKYIRYQEIDQASDEREGTQSAKRRKPAPIHSQPSPKRSIMASNTNAKA